MLFTFSRSGSRKAKASSLLSITEAAATSSGVEPLIAGEAVNWNKDETKPELRCNYEFHVKKQLSLRIQFLNAIRIALIQLNLH